MSFIKSMEIENLFIHSKVELNELIKEAASNMIKEGNVVFVFKTPDNITNIQPFSKVFFEELSNKYGYKFAINSFLRLFDKLFDIRLDVLIVTSKKEQDLYFKALDYNLKLLRNSKDIQVNNGVLSIGKYALLRKKCTN